MEEALAKAKGINGQLELYQDTLAIERKGFAAKGKGGYREIPLRQIASIEFKDAGRLTAGHIQFVLGGQEAVSGHRQVSNDPNTVMFNYGKRKPIGTSKPLSVFSLGSPSRTRGRFLRLSLMR